ARASNATSAAPTSSASRVPPADTAAPGMSNATKPGTDPSSTISGPPRSGPATGSSAMPPPMIRGLESLTARLAGRILIWRPGWTLLPRWWEGHTGQSLEGIPHEDELRADLEYPHRQPAPAGGPGGPPRSAGGAGGRGGDGPPSAGRGRRHHQRRRGEQAELRHLRDRAAVGLRRRA